MESRHPHIAIIGAGLSGAYLTSLLVNAGMKITLFEKSRGTGGRIASCRLNDFSADLGAPYFSAITQPFQHWLTEQPEIETWSPITSDFLGNPLTRKKYFVASPRQSALTRRLIKGANFLPTQRIGYVWPERTEGGIRTILRDDKGLPLGTFDAAIIATPAKQAVPLLESIPRFVRKAESSTPMISWVEVLAIRPISASPSELIVGQHEILSRCIKDSGKPNRDGTSNNEVWVLEATEAWSQLNQHCSAHDVGHQLKSSFFNTLKCTPEVLSERTHRWLYARHKGTGDRYLWDPNTCIGACGDWLINSDVEGAWQSASLLAELLLEHFKTSA